MLTRHHGLILFSMAMITAGCHGTRYSTAHDLQMQAMDRSLNDPKMYFVNMVDNAILHDMSIADIHFVPHSNELSGTGVARLDRMAPLLNTYGGIVRYETVENDQEMIKARIDHVQEYLSVVGCNMENVLVKVMISGGRGMSAKRALAKEEQADSASAPGTASSIPSLTGVSNN